MRLSVGETFTCHCVNKVTRMSVDHYVVTGFSILVDSSLYCHSCKETIQTKPVIEFTNVNSDMYRQVMEGQKAQLPENHHAATTSATVKSAPNIPQGVRNIPQEVHNVPSLDDLLG